MEDKMTNEETLNVQEEQSEPTDQSKRRSPSKGFNAKVGEAELLAEAMGANQETLAPGGGGEEFVNELKEVVAEIKKLNQDQGDFRDCPQKFPPQNSPKKRVAFEKAPQNFCLKKF